MTSTSLLSVSASENQDGILSTPTRFLMECGEWNFTPSLSTFASEMNPFDYIGIQKAKEGAVTTTATKPHSPPTPPNSKEYVADKSNNEEIEKNTDAPPTPPQQKAKRENIQRRPQEVNREKVSSNASLDSESSSTSGEQATGMKALTKAVEIERQQLKKQRQLQQQQELMQQPPRQTTNAKPRSQRSRPHQYSFHSYQPSKQASHPSAASTTNTTLIIKQENGQPNAKSRRQKEKSDSSGSPESGLERKRQHSEEDDDEAADRRRKFLERNRVAASKCRQKKKAWVNNLEERSEQVIEENKRLFNMVSQLKEEAMFLKNQLLAHGNCSCNVAKQYLQQSSTFAPTIRDSDAQLSQGMMPPPPPQQKPKTSGKDYFSPVHSTPTPSLPPLRSISPD